MNIAKASREFQVFAKPVGSICNLGCHYCYYLKKEHLYPESESFRMTDDVLEEYIVQHIKASPSRVIRFSWHGGEPTVLGLDYFRKIVALQRKHRPPNRRIANGIQTNGTLLDEDWCRFLKAEGFAVGLSLDGPQEMHDRYRVTKSQKPTYEQAMRGYELLQQHRIYCDILCVVNEYNVQYPIQVYQFFKQIGARYISFLPLVEPQADVEDGVVRFAVPDETVSKSPRPPLQGGEMGSFHGSRLSRIASSETTIHISHRTVPAEAFGAFLCDIFDEWMEQDIGEVKVQIFEEAATTAFGQEHGLCIFRRTCGDIPVIEHNGDFFSCDHFVDAEHRPGNIQETPFVELLESPAQRAFGQAKLDTLPRYCQTCEVRAMCNGGCPKNRFIHTPDGEAGLNYLCAGYKRFFKYCQPFVSELAALLRQGIPERQTPQAQTKVGRNDPCPCGSGLKYKKCCMGK